MSEQRVAKKASRVGGWITRSLLLVLLLCLAVFAAAGYYYGLPFANNLLDERDAIKASVEELESANTTILEKIPLQIDTVIDERFAQLIREQDAKLSKLSQDVARISASEQRLKEALTRAESQLERQSGVDQAAWRIAEAEFNVRMANQRLQVARDVSAALVLLRGADQLLVGVDTRKAEILRSSLASHIAELSALPQVDRIGILSQLHALEQQVRQLELVSLGFDPQDFSEPATDEALNSASFLQQAMGVISSYFVVTALESAEVRPLPGDWAVLAKSSLAAMFEQARLALLMGDQSNFVASLQRAELFLRQHARADDSRAMSITKTLRTLMLLEVAPSLPSLSETLSAFRDEPLVTPDIVDVREREEVQ